MSDKIRLLGPVTDEMRDLYNARIDDIDNLKQQLAEARAEIKRLNSFAVKVEQESTTALWLEYCDFKEENAKLRDALEEIHKQVFISKKTQGWDSIPYNLHKALSDLFELTEKYRALKEEENTCDHDWVCADNEVVTGGEICLKCQTIQATPKEEV